MKPIKKLIPLRQRGAALIVSMIFVLVCSALAVAMFSLSNTNVQLAENQRKADCVRACAESGHEIIRYWLNRVSIPGNTALSQRFNLIASSLQSELNSNGITNITTSHTGSNIVIPTVTLDSAQQKSFSAVITQISDSEMQVDVTGAYGQLNRTIRTNYTYGTRPHSVFDFGVASKGPLSLAGNIELEGANVSVEASAYIESENSNLALTITGNSQIAGDVSIVNPDATVDLQGGQAGIGGETGQAAIDNHVSFGCPPTEFPAPDPGMFEQYVTNIIDSSNIPNADATFENVRIAAGTNPTFSEHITLKGIVFIETPNVVTFAGTADVIGIIVGNGNVTDNSETNQIIFEGNVNSSPVTALPDEPQFEDIKNKTGTFLMAPGFKLSFGGSFETINGAIAGNSINFFGNAGGTVNGSIINYSNEEMTLSGNSDLNFNRSGTDKVPAGFVPEIVLHYNPSSYSEMML